MLFSIIIPTYNRSSLISTTIHSILKQDYPNFEIIVVDDGSTDDTMQVVQAIKDPRIRYFYKANEERAAARNYGVLRSKGDYVTFIDSDDILYSNHFSEANRLINKHNFPDVFHLGYEVRGVNGKLLRTVSSRKGRTLNNNLLTGNHLSCIGVFLKKEISILNPFNQDKGLTKAEDWELWLRLAARFDIFYSNTITSCMLEHSGRSLNKFNLGDHMYATELLLLNLRSDEVFMSKYGHKLHFVESEMVSLMGLDLVLANETAIALSFLFEAISINHLILFKRRTYAILKQIVIQFFKRGVFTPTK